MRRMIPAILLFLAFSTPVIAQEAAGSGDTFVEAAEGWRTYVNGRYGMRVSYPAHLFNPAPPPDRRDGRRFEGSQASFEVFGWENDGGNTGPALASELVGTAGYEEVKHLEASDSELLISGTRDERSFLEKYVFGETTVEAFGIEYPTRLRAEWETVAAAMAQSFRSGDGPAPGCSLDVPCAAASMDRPAQGVVEAAIAPGPAPRQYFRLLGASAAKAAKAKGPKKAKKRKKGKRGRKGGRK